MSDRVQALAATVVARTAAIAAIPAPTGSEVARAARVTQWWHDDDWGAVHTDATGNVWAAVGPGETDPGGVGAIVLAAHLDTVFPADLPHTVIERDGRLIGPSVGDDAVALAALSAIGALIAGTTKRPVWLLATVGEEGLGNLRGVSAALDSLSSPVAALLALEGNYLGRVSATGVGSLRWRVSVSGPGGHAWEAADVPSAIHVAAAVVGALARLEVVGARTVVNIGRIGGGEAINARARDCWFELDVRADDAEALHTLESEARALIETNTPDAVDVEIDELGRRPAGALDPNHALVRAAVAALEASGIALEFVATSTDANAAHARGIPAIAIGITTGGGEHTPNEWIDLAPIANGLSVAASTVQRFDEEAR
ncbi:MAG: tripeptide aminopeptidase [Actinomycetota bacterium]|nr:tripeptide aminopeptidase [Actinomycetota bacterium]